MPNTSLTTEQVLTLLAETPLRIAALTADLTPEELQTRLTPHEWSCIGYLDHPFEKEDPWAFTARIFLVVKWGLAIEIAGDEFSYTRETTRVWAADHEDRPAKVAGEACHRPLQP